MEDKAGTEGGLVDKIKSWIPKIGFKNTAPIPKPPIEEPRTAPEKTPQALSSFEELEKFLAKESGISTPDAGRREATISREDYIGSSPNSHIKQPIRLRIEVEQYNINKGMVEWDGGDINISIRALIPNPLAEGEPNYKMGWDEVHSLEYKMFGYPKNSTTIVISKGKPAAVIGFNPDNALGQRMVGGTSALGKGLDVDLGLDKRKWQSGGGQKQFGGEPPFTTNDEVEIAKVVRFVVGAGSKNR